MFNKKAIAALAAGATLVSGLAFAAPAMAKDPDFSPLLVQDVNAAKVAKAKEDLKKDQKTLDDAKKDLEKEPVSYTHLTLPTN